MPTSGPPSRDIQEVRNSDAGRLVQVIDVNDEVARQLSARNGHRLFSEEFGALRASGADIGPGDLLEVTIWEAPPATLFGAGPVDPRLPATAKPTLLPEQMVDADGTITVPFVGRLKVAGLKPTAVEAEVARRLRNKANQPEVVVRVVRSVAATVTVVGEVSTSIRMPLTAGGERLLDALAAAGGVRQPVSKMTLQVTRGDRCFSMPLDQIIRDPRQNVTLQPGDVVTAMNQPLSFTSLGATGKNDEIAFETQGISLAQALARVGGVSDTRADARGVFIFRLERSNALDWPSQPVVTTPDHLVPVVYRVDLRDPRSFFAMQHFMMSNKDVLYVANAPAAELQKFLNLVFSITFPIINTLQNSN